MQRSHLTLLLLAALGLMLGVLVSRALSGPGADRADPRVRELPRKGAPPPRLSPGPSPSAPILEADAQTEPTLDVERSSEDALMAAAERALESAPQRTLVLIEAADRRFGAHVEERRKLEIQALVRLQRIGLAHAKADRFYRSFPDSPSVSEIERWTGYHPRPTGPDRD